MAGRYPKLGLDYYPKSVNLHREESIKLLRVALNWKGYLIMLSLHDYIFGNRGYYVEWTEQNEERFRAWSELCPFVSPNTISETVTACLKYGIFDKNAFETCNILTSNDIQHTWLIATRKRIRRYIVREYWIYGAILAEEKEFMAEEIRQSKGNKIFFINKEDTVVEDAIREMEAEVRAEKAETRANQNSLDPRGDYKISYTQFAQSQRFKPVEFCDQIRGLSIKFKSAPNKQIEEYFATFIKRQELAMSAPDTEPAIIIHFINWLDKQLKPPKPKNEKIEQNSGKNPKPDSQSGHGKTDL